VTVAFYISGHGFGHASRQVEIVNTFGLRHPEIRLSSAAPRRAGCSSARFASRSSSTIGRAIPA
jgi:hypothetical protein